jgi:hypothetical protein
VRRALNRSTPTWAAAVEGWMTCVEGDKLCALGGGGEEGACRKKVLDFDCSGTGKEGENEYCDAPGF